MYFGFMFVKEQNINSAELTPVEMFWFAPYGKEMELAYVSKVKLKLVYF